MRQSNPVTDKTVVAAAVAQEVMDVPLVSVHACGANSASDATAAVPSESKLLAEALEFPNSSVTIDRFDENELVARRRSTMTRGRLGCALIGPSKPWRLVRCRRSVRLTHGGCTRLCNGTSRGRCGSLRRSTVPKQIISVR
ncbi:hypothetical protein TcBrA4_0041540 [Trypanosoma cruzi]|nr:hypothetical protein TcBrA4_0041540 [Trypanosoma cruzi]